jgi:hypothetical protein
VADDIRDADAAHRVPVTAVRVERTQQAQPVEKRAIVIMGGVHAPMIDRRPIGG